MHILVITVCSASYENSLSFRNISCFICTSLQAIRHVQTTRLESKLLGVCTDAVFALVFLSIWALRDGTDTFHSDALCPTCDDYLLDAYTYVFASGLVLSPVCGQTHVPVGIQSGQHAVISGTYL